MNISAEDAAVDLADYADWELTASLSANGDEIKQKGNKLDLPAWGVAILTPMA